jgi:predicted molibdopterin-dependent oxidoreductase YjgC
VSFKIDGPGTLIGGLAVLWAGAKSKIFGSKNSEDKIEQIKADHNLKRSEWQTAKEEYDSRFRMLQAQMQYIDYKSALISEKISNLDEHQKQKIKEIESANSDQLLKLLNERNKP